MSRIVWTKAERQRVAEELFAIWVQDPDKLWSLALVQAQSREIDPERRVKVSDRAWQYRNRHWIAPAHARALAKRAEGVAATNIPDPIPKREESTVERLAGILEQLVDLIADRVTDRVMARMNPPDPLAIRAAIDQQFDIEHRKHNPLPLDEAKCEGKPGVLIVGLIPQQEQHIRASFGERFDLCFLDAESAKVRPALRRAHTILMTKFISHPVQDKYRHAPALHYCNGSVSELLTILDGISQR